MLHELGRLPMGWLLVALLVIAVTIGFTVGRVRAERFAHSPFLRTHSRPNYHGYFVAMWAIVPAVAVAVLYVVFAEAVALSLLRRELPAGMLALPAIELDSYLNAVAGVARTGGYVGEDRLFAAVSDRYLELKGALKLVTLLGLVCVSAIGTFLALRRIGPEFRSRVLVERGFEWFLFVCAAIAIATTVGIVLSLFYESLRFFAEVPPWEFVFGLRWNAQTSAEFGALPLFYGTFAIAFIAMCVAGPIGLFAAIYLSEYAGSRFRATVKPIVEVLAGIPTVVYGFFALMVVAPAVRSVALWVNSTLISIGITDSPLLAAQPTSAIAAGLVMGVMVIPFVSSLSDDVINAVPDNLRDAAYAMGATKSETISQVVLPAALPGIIASMLLAISRAIGETMIVVMAAGQRARISADPTTDLTTITVQIVALLTGETEFDSAKTLSAFALGLILFLTTLVFNLLALHVANRFRDKYE